MENTRILGRKASEYLYDYVSGLWVITPYYNPLGYASRRANYQIFVRLLQESGLNVLTVECAFGDQPYDLPDSPDVVKVRSRSLLWQKERLLNLALPWLPPSCKYVAWLDCDIVFANPEWARETVRLLEEVPVVQVFETVNRLPQGLASPAEDIWPSFAKVVTDNRTVLHSGNKYADHGHTGYGWAARREVLERHGLYEHAIVGTADDYMSHAIMGDFESPCILRVMGGNELMQSHLLDWARPFHETVGGRLKAVHGTVLHLWHGDLANRKYYIRHQEFMQFGFNPYRDLVAVPGQPFELRPELADSGLAEWFKAYFASRREDGSLAVAA
jgi:hypothetical protein